jgi:hypothetical protein
VGGEAVSLYVVVVTAPNGEVTEVGRAMAS